MPTFSYKGYNFDVDHTPTEQEFSQMSAYVDSLPPKEEKKEKAGIMTGLKSAFAGVGNTVDLVGTTIAGGGAALFGDDKEAVRLADEMEARRASRNQWANPDNQEIGMAGKLAGVVGTLPMQMVTMGLSPTETAYQAKQAGETNEAARKAAGIDALGNAAGILIPGFKQGSLAVRAATGAGVNMAQEVATKKAIQATLDTEKGKQMFAPTLEDTLVSGIVGAGVGAGSGKAKKYVPTPKATNALAALDAMAQMKKAPTPESAGAPGSNAWQDAQLKLRAEMDAREAAGPTNETAQIPMEDQGKTLSPFEATQGEWRVDENGMPIRADLTMDAQNVEQPLQRNLWGDELDTAEVPRNPQQPLPLEGGDIPGAERFSEPVNFRNDPENQIPLTQAMDSMDPAARSGAIEQTQLGREMPASPDMEVARMEAETASWLEANRRPPIEKTPLGSKERKAAFARMGRAKKQGGGITTDIFGRTPERSEKLQDLLQFVPYRFQALESLPNKNKVTYEQVKQLMGRQEVSGAEKKIIQDAYGVALFTSDADFVTAKEFADALTEVTQDYTLSRTPSQDYADFGLDRLGRDVGTSWEQIPRNEWTPEQLQEHLDYNIFPERKVTKQDASVVPETNIWGNVAELSSQTKNHFDDSQYVGHTRNFKEDGVRHVVELQSDLLQKAPPNGGIFQEYHGIPDSMLNGRLEAIEQQIKRAESSAHQPVEDLYGQRSRVKKEIQSRQEATNKSDTIKTLQKNWAVRLIREELADAARKGEPTVRFASADTMAKVEGWPDEMVELRWLVKDTMREKKGLENILERNPEHPGKERLQQEIDTLQQEIEKHGRQFLEMEKSGSRFDPQVQGIYDRYQKDVSKYLKSIGGKEVTDATGNTWLEVPVDKSRSRPIMFGQRGGVLFDWKNKDKVDVLKGVGGFREKMKMLTPSDMTAEAVVEQAKSMKDIDQNAAQKFSNNFTKGGLYQAEKTGNPLVKFAVDKIVGADRLARANTRDLIHDTLAPAMRALSTPERTEIAMILNHADKIQQEVTPDFLRAQGLSEKQVAFAEAHKATMDAAFEGINKARAAAGKDPIDRRVAYSAMNARGDFRKLVHTLDENGDKTVVGFIGAKTRWGLNSLEKKLKASNPEYIVESKERYMGGASKERGGSAVAAVQQALEMLADENPKTREFLDLLDNIKTDEAYSYMGAKAHTKQKKGVFGMEGRKPWESEEQNAKDFMDAQLQYAEAAINWGHKAEAATEIKKVLTAEDVSMPEAKKWVEQYTQNSLGMNPSKVGRAAEQLTNSVWEATGIGRTIPANIQMYSKKAVNTMLLGLNPAFLATNVIQPMLAMPAMTSLLKSRGLDTMTTGYDSMAKAGFTMFKEQAGKLSPLEQAAQEYAHKNHVFGSDLVDTSTLSRKNAEYYIDKAGNFLASNVESGTRKLMFYGFVHMLDANGIKDFGLAHNLTDMAMNNYSPVERPHMYNALGPVGDMAANLSSYKHNELSRLALFAREIGKDKSASPFLMQIATSAAAAGITGMLGFQEADWLYKQVTKAMGAPDSLSRVVIDFSEKAAGEVGSDKGKYALSHGVFSLLGLDMSKRLGISDVIPNSLGEAMFPGGSKLVDVAGAGLSAMKDPSEMNLKRFAREASPGLITGPMDRAWFSSDATDAEGNILYDAKGQPQEVANNRNPDKNLTGQVIRNDADKMAKNFGFTGINESVQKQKLYELQQQGIGYQELRQAVFKKMTDQMYSKGRVDPHLIQNYMKYKGDLDTLNTSLVTAVKNQSMSAVDAAKMKALAAKTVSGQLQGQRVLKAFNE